MSAYRKPMRPAEPERKRVIATSVDPPPDPAADAERARREGAKLMAAEMEREHRDRERAARGVRVTEIVVEILRGLIGW